MTWRCEDCQAVYETKDPPCEACGCDSLVSTSEPAVVEANSTFVWACPDCGREHVKNSPPCSRCGNPILEQRKPLNETPEPPKASYVGVVKPYIPVIALFAVVIGLTATGLVSLDMLPGHGPPSPPDAPGEDTQVGDVAFDVVESEVHAQLEADRDRRGVSSRTYDNGLGQFVEYVNKQQAIAYHGGPLENPPDPNDFDLSCGQSRIITEPTVLGMDSNIEEFETESALATEIAAVLRSEHSEIVYDTTAIEALDVHVGEGGTVFVYYATC